MNTARCVVEGCPCLDHTSLLRNNKIHWRYVVTARVKHFILSRLK